MDDIDVVGQTSSFVDVVSGGELPVDQELVEQGLQDAANSPNGNLLKSLIRDDYRRANIQLLMNSGDNQQMQKVVDASDEYLAANPLPARITASWAGETYLNLIWQEKMVSGMMKAFLTTFAIVLVLLVILFRSIRWAVAAMLPMTITVLFVYGILGFAGKNYDMPLAVLSTLVLGIAIDFAIHFVQRYRELESESGTTLEALRKVFEEPTRAITRNALIIAIGFAPMFLSSLMPYLAVGALMATIMVVSWLATLLLLPALTALFLGAKKQPA